MHLTRTVNNTMVAAQCDRHEGAELELIRTGTRNYPFLGCSTKRPQQRTDQYINQFPYASAFASRIS